MAGLLQGLKVVELGLLLPSTYMGQLLADQGAEVLKVEAPPTGDYIRYMPGHIGTDAAHSAPHLLLNRNKQSVFLNLRTEEGQRFLHELVRPADVFITNLLAGQPEKLGAGYETLRQLNPGLVYCQLTAFGTTGPYARLPTHGSVMAAAIGQVPLTVGEDGFVVQTHEQTPTTNAGQPVVVGPLFGVFGIMAALWRRERTGQGAYIDMAQTEAALNAAWLGLGQALNQDNFTNEPSSAQSGRHAYYQTRDDRFVFIALIEPKFWRQFCIGVAREDLLVGLDQDALAFDHFDEVHDRRIREELRAIFRTRTRAEWVQFFLDHDLAGGPAYTAAELPEDPHFRARGVFVEQQHPVAGTLRMVTEPVLVAGETYGVPGPAPEPGADTYAVLERFGHARDELDDLHAKGVL